MTRRAPGSTSLLLQRAIVVGIFVLSTVPLAAQSPPPRQPDPTPTLPVMPSPPAPPRASVRAVEGAEAAKPREAPVPESQVAKPAAVQNQAPAPAPSPIELVRTVQPAPKLTSATAAQVVAPPEIQPANATGRCHDGTFLTAAVVDANSCVNNGGLLAIFPQKRVPQPPRRP